MTGLEYADKYFDFVRALKGLVEGVSPTSDIDTRYISSNGRNDDEWIAYLTNPAGVVDRWMITAQGFMGEAEVLEDPNAAPVGRFQKPMNIVVDYFADYRFGEDVVGAVGAETTTNTEHEFIKKLLALDLELEKKRRCLQTNVEILNWTFTMRLRRFKTATTHWASGNLTIRFTDLPL